MLRSMVEVWNDFFFTPRSPLPVALFRIFYGLCVSATLLLLHGDWLHWFGVHSWIPLPTMMQAQPGPRINLFAVLPQDDGSIAAFFWVCLGFAVLLMAGLWTRLSSVAVFLCLTSLQQRNLFILHSGDVFLRVTGFFLIFAPAGAALSLDRWIRVRRGKESVAVQPRAPWAQRMIQLELALLYLASFCWKMKGSAWPHGTALYYVIHLHSMARFPLPGWIHHPWILRLGSWLTLLTEFCLGVLIWFRRFRYPLLLLGVLFHLCLEYALNVPIFQWEVLAAYVLFVEAADIERVLGIVRRRRAENSDASATAMS